MVFGTGKRKSGQCDGCGFALGVGRIHARRVQYAGRDFSQRKPWCRPVRHVPVQHLAVLLAVQVLGEHFQHEYLRQTAVVAGFAPYVHGALRVVPDSAVVYRLRFTCIKSYVNIYYCVVEQVQCEISKREKHRIRKLVSENRFRRENRLEQKFAFLIMKIKYVGDKRKNEKKNPVSHILYPITAVGVFNRFFFVQTFIINIFSFFFSSD